MHGSWRWRGAIRVVGALLLQDLVQPHFWPAQVAVSNDRLVAVSVSTIGSTHRRQPLRC